MSSADMRSCYIFICIMFSLDRSGLSQNSFEQTFVLKLLLLEYCFLLQTIILIYWFVLHWLLFIAFDCFYWFSTVDIGFEAFVIGFSTVDIGMPLLKLSLVFLSFVIGYFILVWRFSNGIMFGWLLQTSHGWAMMRYNATKGRRDSAWALVALGWML